MGRDYHQAITSAELKLLRLRRTLLRPGRPDFEVGTTTAATLFATHASDVAVAVRLRLAASLNEEVCCGRFEAISVGSRDRLEDGSVLMLRTGRGGICGALAAANAFAAEVVRVVASRGILFGP